MKNKLLFLIFLMFPTLMLADYTFIVENQAMVESYFNIFNAISALLSSEDYLDLLRLTFLLGGFFVFASSVLTAWEGSANAKILSPYGKYLITGVALLTLVFSYKEPIWVTTNNIPSFCATPHSGLGGATPGGTMVGTAVNLPSVLGFVFSTTNKIGDGLTKLAESAFSTPSSTGTASMTDSGGYLGALKQTISIMSYNPSAVNMVDSTGNTIDGSADFLNLWGTFFSQCVYAVANNKGTDGDTVINQLKSSKNIFTYIDNYIKNYTYPGDNKPVSKYLVESNGTHYECGNFYEFLAKDSANKLTNNFACSNPKMNGGVIELLTGNTTGATVSYLNEIALQSGLINALSVSGSINSVGINGANFVEGKSRAEASQNNLASASYMAQMLPYIQMTMRAILYAFFPFVFVVMLLPGGIKVLAQYGQTILWIELWTPTAAVVNMFVNMQVKDQVGGAYGATGLTYMSSINMLGDANTIAGVGAMLYLSIPALTWLILKGSGQMLGNVAGGVMGTFGKNLDSKSVAQDMNYIKGARQSGKSISDTINSLEQMEVANKYGQAIGFENAGGMNSSMKNAQIKTQSELSSTVEKINAMGGVNSVINSNVAKDLKEALTNQNHLRETGILDQNNNLNHKTINELSKTDAGAQAIKTLANSESYKKYAADKGMNPNSLETMNSMAKDYSKSEGEKNFVDYESNKIKQDNTDQSTTAKIEGAEKVEKVIETGKTQQKNEVTNEDYSINKEGLDKKTETSANKNEKDYLTEQKIQKELSSEDRSTQESIKSIYENSSTKAQFLSNVGEAINQGTVKGTMDKWENKANELFQNKTNEEQYSNVTATEKNIDLQVKDNVQKDKNSGAENQIIAGTLQKINQISKTKAEFRNNSEQAYLSGAITGEQAYRDMLSKAKEQRFITDEDYSEATSSESLQRLNKQLSNMDTAGGQNGVIEKQVNDDKSSIRDLIREQVNSEGGRNYEEKEREIDRRYLLARDKQGTVNGDDVSKSIEREFKNAGADKELNSIIGINKTLDMYKNNLNNKDLSNEHKEIMKKEIPKLEALIEDKTNNLYKKTADIREFYQKSGLASFDENGDILAIKDDMSAIREGNKQAIAQSLGTSQGKEVRTIGGRGQQITVAESAVKGIYGVDEKRMSWMRSMNTSADVGYALTHSNTVSGSTVATVNKGMEVIGGAMRTVGWFQLLKNTTKSNKSTKSNNQLLEFNNGAGI